MTSQRKTGRAWAYAAMAVGLVAMLGFFAEPIRLAYEIVSVNLFPDANKAFAYGQRHFNSRLSEAYDVDAAEYFFWKTHALDTEVPYLYHEIARVAFLRGEFDSALVFINTQLEKHGGSAPSSYYVRGLIQGYRGAYDAAAKDYEIYLKYDPVSWAALNDYAWVLLKAGRPDDALTAAAQGNALFSGNAWLLNTETIALYELGHYEASYRSAEQALRALENVNEADWLAAYPGNDPATAREGMATLRGAIEKNMHMARAALARTEVE